MRSWIVALTSRTPADRDANLKPLDRLVRGLSHAPLEDPMTDPRPDPMELPSDPDAPDTMRAPVDEDAPPTPQPTPPAEPGRPGQPGLPDDDPALTS